MEKLSQLDIVRLGMASPKAAALIKMAQKDAGFDENVQGNQPPQDPSQLQAGQYPSNQAAPQKQAAVPPEDEYAAIPEEDGMMQGEAMQETPEDVGARAAQSFMAPFFDSAMAGDPNAQQMVARAAGQIASSAAESYANAGAQQSMSQGIDGELPQDQMGPPAIASPEEDLANSIVQDTQKAPPPPNGQEEAPEEDSNGNGDNGGNGNGKGGNGGNGNGESNKKGTFPPKKKGEYGKSPEKK